MKKNISKIIFSASVASFIIFGVLFFVLYQKVGENMRKVEDSAAEWNSVVGKQGNTFSLNRMIEELSKNKELIDGHFADNSDIVSFLDTLESLAPKTGVKLEVDSVNSKEDNTKLQVGLKALGSFSSVYRFLLLLENSPYELDFLSVDFHKVQNINVDNKKIKESIWEGVFKIQLISQKI